MLATVMEFQLFSDRFRTISNLHLEVKPDNSEVDPTAICRGSFSS